MITSRKLHYSNNKTFIVYLLMISLFSIEGFSLFPGFSYTTLIGLVLVLSLSVKLAITKESFPPDSSYKYFLLFFMGSLVSFTVAKDLKVSITIYMTYISLFLLYIITRHFLKSIEDIKKALNYLFISTLITFAFVEIFSLHVKVGDDGSRISGGIGDPNEYASYILVLLPLAFYRAINSFGAFSLFYWGILVSFIILVIFTGSRGGLLGLCGAASVLVYHYGYSRMKQIFSFILILIVILYFFVPENFWIRASTIVHPEIEEEYQGTSISSRKYSYEAALRMFLDYPLTGVGLYHFQTYGRRYGALTDMVVHNTYLEILTGGGLLSFIPFALILINSWRKLGLNKTYEKMDRDLLICLKASFVSILITSIFISADHDKILWFLLALISASYYIANRHKSVRPSLLH